MVIYIFKVILRFFLTSLCQCYVSTKFAICHHDVDLPMIVEMKEFLYVVLYTKEKHIEISNTCIMPVLVIGRVFLFCVV